MPDMLAPSKPCLDAWVADKKAAEHDIGRQTSAYPKSKNMNTKQQQALLEWMEAVHHAITPSPRMAARFSDFVKALSEHVDDDMDAAFKAWCKVDMDENERRSKLQAASVARPTCEPFTLTVEDGDVIERFVEDQISQNQISYPRLVSILRRLLKHKEAI